MASAPYLMGHTSLILNIALLIVGSAATLSAFGGETWEEGQKPILQRITLRGWISLLCLVSAFVLGVLKEEHAKRITDQDAIAAERREKELKEQFKALKKSSDVTSLQLSLALKALTEQKGVVDQIDSLQTENKNISLLGALAVGGKATALEVNIPVSPETPDSGPLEAFFPDWTKMGLRGEDDHIVELDLRAQRSFERGLYAWVAYSPSNPHRPRSSGSASAPLESLLVHGEGIHADVSLIRSEPLRLEIDFGFDSELFLRDWMKVMIRDTRIVNVQLMFRSDIGSAELARQVDSFDRRFSRTAWIDLPLKDQEGMTVEYMVSRDGPPKTSNGNFTHSPGQPGQTVVSGPLPIVASIEYAIVSEPSFHSRLIENISASRQYRFERR